MINITVIIISFNTKDLTLECIKSVQEKTKKTTYEIIVIDNKSTDGSVESLKKTKGIRLILNMDNVGFSKANNQGIVKSSGRYILLLNSDTYLLEDSLGKMVEWMDKNHEVGISSCKLLNLDNTIQENGGFFPTLSRVILWSTLLDDIPGIGELFGSFHPKRNFFKSEHRQDWVKGAFMLLRKDVLEKTGGLDEKIFMYAEDVEFCFRVKLNGWNVVYTPETKIVHIGGASGATENTILREYQGILYFYKKHKNGLENLILKFAIKLGALLRIILFTILGRKELVDVYAKVLVTN